MINRTNIQAYEKASHRQGREGLVGEFTLKLSEAQKKK